MRHPFYMDHLDPADRKVVKRLHAGVVSVYLVLLLLLMFVVKLHAPNARIIAADSEDAAAAPAQSMLSNMFSAAAAERPATAQCASRDLKIAISLADHGDAMDVPAEALNAAFLALVKARAICAAGRIDEALAIYDGIVIAPATSARK